MNHKPWWALWRRRARPPEPLQRLIQALEVRGVPATAFAAAGVQADHPRVRGRYERVVLDHHDGWDGLAWWWWGGELIAPAGEEELVADKIVARFHPRPVGPAVLPDHGDG